MKIRICNFIGPNAIRTAFKAPGWDWMVVKRFTDSKAISIKFSRRPLFIQRVFWNMEKVKDEVPTSQAFLSLFSGVVAAFKVVEFPVKLAYFCYRGSEGYRYYIQCGPHTFFSFKVRENASIIESFKIWHNVNLSDLKKHVLPSYTKVDLALADYDRMDKIRSRFVSDFSHLLK